MKQKNLYTYRIVKSVVDDPEDLVNEWSQTCKCCLAEEEPDVLAKYFECDCCETPADIGYTNDELLGQLLESRQLLAVEESLFHKKMNNYWGKDEFSNEALQEMWDLMFTMGENRITTSIEATEKSIELAKEEEVKS